MIVTLQLYQGCPQLIPEDLKVKTHPAAKSDSMELGAFSTFSELVCGKVSHPPMCMAVSICMSFPCALVLA